MKILLSSLVAILLLQCSNKTKPTVEDSKTQKNMTNQDVQHSSMNALDWSGVYRGLVPCEDCDATKIELDINDNGVYVIQRLDIAKDTEVQISKGNVEWTQDGSSIRLNNPISPYSVYKVGESGLFPLDENMNRIKDKQGELTALDKYKPQLQNQNWRLLAAKSKKISKTMKTPFMKFEKDRVFGNLSCNNFNGAYEIKESNIQFKPLMSTKMACPDMGVEDQFQQLLMKVSTYELQGTRLALKDAQGQELLYFINDFFMDK